MNIREINGEIDVKLSPCSITVKRDGKKIPNSVVYSVDEFEGDNLNCFKTLKEARQYAKNY